MKLELNGQEYEVPQSFDATFVNQLYEHGREEYEKQDPAIKALIMVPTRMILGAMEKSLTKSQGKEVALRVCRPAKKEDPNLFLLRFIGGLLMEAMKYAELSIMVEEADTRRSSEDAIKNNTVTGLSLSFKQSGTGEAGGSLDTDREYRQWENNSTQVSG
jgi:hypothetical protein